DAQRGQRGGKRRAVERDQVRRKNRRDVVERGQITVVRGHERQRPRALPGRAKVDDGFLGPESRMLKQDRRARVDEEDAQRDDDETGGELGRARHDRADLCYPPSATLRPVSRKSRLSASASRSGARRSTTS